MNFRLKCCRKCQSIRNAATSKQCLICKLKTTANWRKINAERVKEYNKLWTLTNKNYHQEYRGKFQEEIYVRCNRWRKNNPDKNTAKSNRYRANKLKASPKWLTKEQNKEIELFYILSSQLKWLSEEPLEVDHIVPLKGKNVCGLHVPWN